MVRVIFQKDCIAAALGRFSLIHQVASVCTHRIYACFLRPTRVHNPNRISIGSAVFSGLTIVADRPTDRQTMLLRLRCGLIIM